jgi:hypothetical protein
MCTSGAAEVNAKDKVTAKDEVKAKDEGERKEEPPPDAGAGSMIPVPWYRRNHAD